MMPVVRIGLRNRAAPHGKDGIGIVLGGTDLSRKHIEKPMDNAVPARLRDLPQLQHG